eukprot:scaffold454_cov124-Isochrysis_galbana.AAC.3
MPSSLRSVVTAALLLPVSAHGVYEKGSDVVLYANKVCHPVAEELGCPRPSCRLAGRSGCLT